MKGEHLMLEYYINPKEQQKLDIFKRILYSDQGRVAKDLMDTFDLKNETYRRYIKELQDDLKFLFKKKVVLKENSKKKLQIFIQADITINYIITVLRLDYVKKSSLYITMFALLKKRYYSISEIAYDLNFSEPTIYKTLSQIKSLLLRFEGEINLKTNFNFDGNELGVRYFLYLTYWNFFNVVDDNPFSKQLPLEFTDIDYLIDSFKIKKALSNTQRTRLTMMTGIVSYRLVYYKRTYEMSDNFKKDILLFYGGKPCLNLSKFNVCPQIIEDESILLSFLARGLISDLDSFEEKEKIVKRYLTSNLSVATDIERFLELFKTYLSFDYGYRNYIESYYLLIFTYIYEKHIGFKVDQFLNVSLDRSLDSFQSKKEYKKILPKLEELLLHLPLNFPINSLEKDKFISLLYIIYEMNRQTKPVSIYIMHTSGILNTAYVKSILLQFFNKNLISFCDDIEEADIIVSDAHESSSTSKKSFYFENVFNQDTWTNLISFISSYLYKKTFE